MASLFDAFIFVDWSAASTPKPERPSPDAVWVGQLAPRRGIQQETYHRTRESGVAHVASALEDHVQRGARVLVGFDFPYGYPSGFSANLPRPNTMAPWRVVWSTLVERVQDTAGNTNNRFGAASELNVQVGGGLSGPFWGHPVGKSYENLEPRSPRFPVKSTSGQLLQRLRLVESRLAGTQEAWKLFGNGSVGSQALLGIPRVHRMRHAAGLDQVSRVWPFETGFTSCPVPFEGPFVLHVEIWPGVIEEAVRRLTTTDTTLIRDRAQVRAMCEWAAELDAKGMLGSYFDAPTGLTEQQVATCVAEEGWVLGA